MTLAYFCINGLDIMGALDLDDQQKTDVINWIYSLQIVDEEVGGFRGSSSLGQPFNKDGSKRISVCDYGNITMTYTALATLCILKDPLDRVDRKGIVNLIKSVATSDGNFRNTFDGESDMRFVYCVCVICTILNDWSAVDKTLVFNYILKSKGFDGGIAQNHGLESHGGSVYCAVASLYLMNMLDKINSESLVKWCVSRQISGFQGRVNKDVDTCYSFWIVASLRLLNAVDYFDHELNKEYLLGNQSSFGGLSKHFEGYPDVLHSCLGIAALSLLHVAGLKQIDPAFGFAVCRGAARKEKMLRVRAKNAKSKRAVEKKEPQTIENDKLALFLRSTTANQKVTDILGEFSSIKKPLGIYFKKKEVFHPFEEESKVEFLCKKNDASLFAIGQNSKKRPNTIIMGRMFDHLILDMIELSVTNYVKLQQCKMAVGSKPCIIFNGEEFEQSEELKKFENLMLDFFSGTKVNKVNLSGLETLISFTCLNKQIYMRVYNVLLKKSGTRLPRIELESCAFSIDFVIGRSKFASEEMMKLALKKPKELKAKKIKNISRNSIGDKLGRIHLGKQDLSKLQTRKVKGLKRKSKNDEDAKIQKMDE